MKAYLIYPKLLLLLLAIGCGLAARAQEDTLMGHLFEQEQETLEAIALYPETERMAILEAARHPELLARLQSMQARTQDAFQKLIMPLPESEQKRMYSLVRYPELLLAATADGKRKRDAELRKVSEGYPEEVRGELLWASHGYFSLIRQLADLHQQAEQGFDQLLQRYPERTRTAYQQLLYLPEILQLMGENMNATVLLGDLYRQNPEGVQARLNALNVELAEQKTRELMAWKQQLEENPEAMAEYEQAAREFAAEQGYSQATYEAPPAEEPAVQVHVHHVWRPYPYWFGWPYWYAYSNWYPYPWWYHWGYYYGRGNVIVFVGLPSHTFVDWHFHHPRHYYHYPHFTNTFITYGARHPRASNSVSRGVSRWQRDIAGEVPKNWWENDGRRPERIRELGAFKLDYDREVRNRQEGSLSERQYLERNARRYPSLRPLLAESPRPERDASPDVRTRQETRTPRTARQPAAQNPRPQPDYRDRTRVEQKPQTSRDKIDKGRDHHETTWEKARPAPPRATPPRRTEPVQKPAPQRTEKPRSTSRKQIDQ
jgi:hypothetical protein